MTVTSIVNTVFKSCSHVITQDGLTWVVDCGDVDQILPIVEGRLCGVLLTHGHFDHVYGLNSLITLYPHVLVYTCRAGLDELVSDKLNFSRYAGLPFVLDCPGNVCLVDDGASVPLFDGVEAQAVFTPGHCPSCITWVVGDALFTGDSYIPGIKTVANIPHSDKALSLESEAVIRRLAEGRTIYAGHPSKTEN